MKKLTKIVSFLVLFLICGSVPPHRQDTLTEIPKLKLVVLSPAHPHGAHMQEAYNDLFDKEVFVYAHSKEDMQTSYLNLIERYNKKENVLHPWHLHVYTGADYLEKMLQEKKGDLAIIASNNQRKAEYITRTAEIGMDILVDKPMVLTNHDFEKLEHAFEIASRSGHYISDLPSMSMRRFVAYIVQKELVAVPDVFGTLTTGTSKNPAVIQRNHHLYWKGTKRPPWFFDIKQQGDGLTDVTTHLIDIVQWSCFPDIMLDYREDIHITSARTWPTEITPTQFKKATAIDEYPDYLYAYKQDSILKVHANGEINYTLKGTNIQIASTWAFESVSGERDSYESIIKGSKATLKIKAGNQTDLFIEPVGDDHNGMEEVLEASFKRLKQQYPFISLSREENGWRISSEKAFVERKNMIVVPSEWERKNMLAKYYTTTSAYRVAKGIKM